MDVLVIGGGAIGLSISVALAREGHAVQLLERERAGQRASWVAAGMVIPVGLDASSPPPGFEHMNAASARMYPEFAATLLAETGIDPEYDPSGVIYPQTDELPAPSIAAFAARCRSHHVATEVLSRAEVDRLQPGFGPRLRGAAWQPRAATVRPPRLLRALRRAAALHDVALVEHCEVDRLEVRGSRVAGARVTGGQLLEADLIVLAAGAWSAKLAKSVGLSLPIRPVRGQILLLRGAPGSLRHCVYEGHRYLVPRRDGRVLVGSTAEHVGFVAINTRDALADLRRYAAETFAATASMDEELAWAGLRPGTPDGLPYLGRVAALDGLVLATGHYRGGIGMTPITARVVADLVAGRDPDFDLAPYSPERAASW